MNLHLSNKVVIVTGGANGIGAAIGRAFSQEGAEVVVLDRDEAAGASIDFGRFVQVELTDHVAVRSAVEDIASFSKRIDVLVNNAAVNDAAGLDAGPDKFRRSVEQNLVAVYAITHFCAPHLRETEGAIVNIGSKVGETGQGNTSGYAASKGGLLALTREWAIDLAGDNVRVNTVVPAEVWTPQYESWLEKYASDPAAAREEIDRLVPLGRRMTRTDEIADAVLFLASLRASHITGQVIYVDGGYTHLDRAITADRKHLK